MEKKLLNEILKGLKVVGIDFEKLPISIISTHKDKLTNIIIDLVENTILPAEEVKKIQYIYIEGYELKIELYEEDAEIRKLKEDLKNE